jgi:hypothetical protein
LVGAVPVDCREALEAANGKGSWTKPWTASQPHLSSRSGTGERKLGKRSHCGRPPQADGGGTLLVESPHRQPLKKCLPFTFLTPICILLEMGATGAVELN